MYETQSPKSVQILHFIATGLQLTKVRALIHKEKKTWNSGAQPVQASKSKLTINLDLKRAQYNFCLSANITCLCRDRSVSGQIEKQKPLVIKKNAKHASTLLKYILMITAWP